MWRSARRAPTTALSSLRTYSEGPPVPPVVPAPLAPALLPLPAPAGPRPHDHFIHSIYDTNSPPALTNYHAAGLAPIPKTDYKGKAKIIKVNMQKFVMQSKRKIGHYSRCIFNYHVSKIADPTEFLTSNDISVSVWIKVVDGFPIITETRVKFV